MGLSKQKKLIKSLKQFYKWRQNKGRPVHVTVTFSRDVFYRKAYLSLQLCNLYKPNFQSTHENLTLDVYQRQISPKSCFITENRICEKNVIPSRLNKPRKEKDIYPRGNFFSPIGEYTMAKVHSCVNKFLFCWFFCVLWTFAIVYSPIGEKEDWRNYSRPMIENCGGERDGRIFSKLGALIVGGHFCSSNKNKNDSQLPTKINNSFLFLIL